MTDKSYLAALEKVSDLKHQRDKLREALDNLVNVVEGRGGTRPNAMGEARAALKATEDE